MSLTSPGVQHVVDAGEAVELARESNGHARSFMAKHPKLLSAFAAAPLQDVKAACDEISATIGKGFVASPERRLAGARPSMGICR